jgi:hypothetical protein
LHHGDGKVLASRRARAHRFRIGLYRPRRRPHAGVRARSLATAPRQARSATTPTRSQVRWRARQCNGGYRRTGRLTEVEALDHVRVQRSPARQRERKRDLINVRFGPLCGLKSDISRGPRSASFGPPPRSKRRQRCTCSWTTLTALTPRKRRNPEDLRRVPFLTHLPSGQRYGCNWPVQ